MKQKEWIDYDPQWLIDLVFQQQAEIEWLPEALRLCTRCVKSSEAYLYFVDSRKANQPGSELQIERNIILESLEEGTIVLDILKGNRVGGVEFLDKLK